MISLYIKLFRSPPKGTDISLFGKVKDGFFVAPFGFVPFIIHHIKFLLYLMDPKNIPLDEACYP